jgi:hypothetical protein
MITSEFVGLGKWVPVINVYHAYGRWHEWELEQTVWYRHYMLEVTKFKVSAYYN